MTQVEVLSTWITCQSISLGYVRTVESTAGRCSRAVKQNGHESKPMKPSRRDGRLDALRACS